jgi:hypothetical protein
MWLTGACASFAVYGLKTRGSLLMTASRRARGFVAVEASREAAFVDW